MSKIKYAYLKEHTWIYRRNYPKDVRVILGIQAMKQSLKTSDPKVARTRANEVNARLCKSTISDICAHYRDTPRTFDVSNELKRQFQIMSGESTDDLEKAA